LTAGLGHCRLDILVWIRAGRLIVCMTTELPSQPENASFPDLAHPFIVFQMLRDEDPRPAVSKNRD
jgi:hypothetical protein